MERLPIRGVDLENTKDKVIHDQVVAHVEALLDLHQRLHNLTPNTDAYADIGREIAAEDSALDGLVYRLYGLTDEEIGMVEGR
jgi:hypothetical protein